MVCRFNEGYKLVLSHLGNNPRGGTGGEHTEGCQPTGVFEDPDELGE
ncbi:hypothetical protein ES703_121498 [subsurface metagenome]